MKVLKLGKDIKANRYVCDNCRSMLSYTKYDIKTHYGNWQRTGVESSERYAEEHIICPVCNARIILKTWRDSF